MPVASPPDLNLSLRTSEKTFSDKPVTVSRLAYRDLLRLKKALDQSGEEFVRFPDSETKNQSINELFRVKNILKKQGERATAEYGLAVPFEAVQESHRSRKTPAAVEAAPAPARSQSTTYRKLPTFQQLWEYLGAVNEESKQLSRDRFDVLSKHIAEQKKRLLNLDGADETRAIEELSRLNYERRNTKGAVTIEALRNVSADGRFRDIDWENIVSHNIRDYAD